MQYGNYSISGGCAGVFVCQHPPREGNVWRGMVWGMEVCQGNHKTLLKFGVNQCSMKVKLSEEVSILCKEHVISFIFLELL